MNLSDDVAAIRRGVALAVDRAPVCIVVEGDGAFEAVDAALPTDLFLRDAQARQSLLLDASGRAFADVLVARDDERYLLRVEGVDRDRALAHLAPHMGGAQCAAVDVTAVSLHGPWAWELLCDTFGEGLAAIPYLNLFRVEGCLALRAGRTGEYGYEILTPPAQHDTIVARLVERGARFGLRHVSQEAIDHCIWESWFYHPAHAPADVTPVELQLQWRLSPTKRYVGREAVEARRSDPSALRLGCLVTDEALASGDEVRCAGEPVGRVTMSLRSLSRGDVVSQVLVRAGFTHGGVPHVTVAHEGRDVAARVVPPPLVSNWSLAVDPRRHTFAFADEVNFPPLARGGVGVAGLR